MRAPLHLAAVWCLAMSRAVANAWVAEETPVSPTHSFEFTVALTQVGVHRLEAALERVSNPSSAEYGRFLTPEAIRAIVSHSPADLARLREALACDTFAQCSHSLHADYLFVSTTVGQASKLLNVSLLSWSSPTRPGLTVIRARARQHLSHPLPQLADLVETLHGVYELPAQKPSARYRSHSAARLRDDPGVNIDPLVLSKQYGFPFPSAAVLSGQQSCGMREIRLSEITSLHVQTLRYWLDCFLFSIWEHLAHALADRRLL